MSPFTNAVAAWEGPWGVLAGMKSLPSPQGPWCPPQWVGGQDKSEISLGKCLACGHGYICGGGTAQGHTPSFRAGQEGAPCLSVSKTEPPWGKMPTPPLLGTTAHPTTFRNQHTAEPSRMCGQAVGCVSLWGHTLGKVPKTPHPADFGPSTAGWTGSTCPPSPELPGSGYSKAPTAQFPWAPATPINTSQKPASSQQRAVSLPSLPHGCLQQRPPL